MNGLLQARVVISKCIRVLVSKETVGCCVVPETVSEI